MIPNAQEKWSVCPGFDLVLDKIVPGMFFVVSKIGGLALLNTLLDKILVRSRNFAQVSQMPVEGHVVLHGVGGNRRHHHIAAVSRVPGNRERPARRGWLLTRSTCDDRKTTNREQEHSNHVHDGFSQAFLRVLDELCR